MNHARPGFASIIAAIAAQLSFAGTALAQAPQRFTPERVVQFDAGTPKARAMLSKTREVRELVQDDFGIAAVDLNDDGSAEIILIGRSRAWCGSGGCLASVLEKKGPGKVVQIFSQNVLSDLAVTKEKVNGYRALAALDGKGAIAVGDRRGTPLYGKQLVYPIQAAAQKPAAVATAPAASASAGTWDAAKVVAQATGGRLKATQGKYFDKDCQQSLDYSAEVIDLNGVGEPEVFTNVHGTCLGGAAGVHMDLYIKNKNGQWKPQFGFPGIYNLLKTRNKGYPDIEIGGPGTCFPVWRWNGQEYDIYKKCR